MSYDVVIPTSGRASLAQLLAALSSAPGPPPERILVVDDRREPHGAVPIGSPGADLTHLIEVLPGSGRGPAAARNRGWRRARAEWVAFLDDDVVPTAGWRRELGDDLADLSGRVAGSQGRIHVPMPRGRRPTDWERNTAGLESARWATADMVYRRAALASVGGFDERFERAYREDADLGLRLTELGWEIVGGKRTVIHPVRPAGPLVSVRLQAGNADDVRMRALHGSDWRERVGAPRGRLRRHLAVTAAGLVGTGMLAAGRLRAAGAALGLWLAGTAELAWARIVPGPRTPREVAAMAVTSALLPAAASAHWVRGQVRHRRLPTDSARAPRPRPHAALLDRDGTLIRDVPYNGDPKQVELISGADEAVARLRDAGIRLAVVSNQSGIGRGLIRAEQVAAVNRRVEDLLGPLGPWLICPHAPEDGCDCRKPRPGLVLRAAERLGVSPEHCVVIGDIGADVEAAHAAGAWAVLVPTSRTKHEEVIAAPLSAPTLLAAVDHVLGGPS